MDNKDLENELMEQLEKLKKSEEFTYRSAVKRAEVMNELVKTIYVIRSNGKFDEKIEMSPRTLSQLISKATNQ